jgi:Fe-S-cluster containining protein
MDQLFQTKLAVEYFVGDAENGTVFVLSPATDATQPGTIAPFSKPLGTCVFFDSETRTCTIHPVKPFECAIAHHDDARRSAFEIERVKNIRDWSQAQHEIESVYGAKPEEPEGNLVDVFDLFVNRGLTSGWD